MDLKTLLGDQVYGYLSKTAEEKELSEASLIKQSLYLYQLVNNNDDLRQLTERASRLGMDKLPMTSDKLDTKLRTMRLLHKELGEVVNSIEEFILRKTTSRYTSCAFIGFSDDGMLTFEIYDKDEDTVSHHSEHIESLIDWSAKVPFDLNTLEYKK